MLRTIRRAEYFELIVLFFVHAMALSVWFVPLGSILDAHGMSSLKPFAFGTNALAAFVSPLIFGAMADRHASPTAVLRGLSIATAASMAVAATSIKFGWPAWLVLALIQLHALCSAPTFSISTSIVLSRLKSSQREFGPIRATATAGWMAGCWVVSAVSADHSPFAGYLGALVWLVVAGATFLLPEVAPPKLTGALSIRERLGWDALVLLKNPDHRVVFITAALFNIPVAALYPFTPTHLADLGFEHTSAWMSLGQTTELAGMFSLVVLFARWRVKWIFCLGLGFCVARHVLCAIGGKAGLIAGIVLHGCSFALVIITAQIYVDERVDPAWRARAQALMALMTSGVGNLLGYLGTGWWFDACARSGGANWRLFWGGLAAATAAVLVYFLAAYRGRGAALERVT